MTIDGFPFDNSAVLNVDRNIVYLLVLLTVAYALLSIANECFALSSEMSSFARLSAARLL